MDIYPCIIELSNNIKLIVSNEQSIKEYLKSCDSSYLCSYHFNKQKYTCGPTSNGKIYTYIVRDTFVVRTDGKTLYKCNCTPINDEHFKTSKALNDVINSKKYIYKNLKN